ncbi:MAG: hypothetical protein ACOH2E_06590 [Candidatus Paracaedibacter sp.]
MMPLGFIGNVQNCGAMQHDQTENSALLGHANTSINGNARDAEDVEQGRGALTSVVVQSDDLPPKIVIPEDLLRELESSAAAVALANIQDGLYYLRLVKANRLDLIDNLFKARVEEGKYSDRKIFDSRIVLNATEGADLKGPLQEYFRTNNIKIKDLIQKVEELGGREAVLRDIILAEKQQRNLEKNLAERLQRDHEINLAELKSVNRTNLLLKICLPAVFVVAGVGAWAVTWYWGGK